MRHYTTGGMRQEQIDTPGSDHPEGGRPLVVVLPLHLVWQSALVLPIQPRKDLKISSFTCLQDQMLPI